MQVAQGEIHVDGRLDEATWGASPPTGEFTQYEPDQGAAATAHTRVSVRFDDEHLFIAAWCDDPRGSDDLRVPDLRRDFDFFANDLFGVVLDPLLTQRDAVTFQVNPYGALRDLQSQNDSILDLQWDAPWRARTNRTHEGWTAELAIPWRALRYDREGRSWGINFIRILRRRDERSTWAPIPRAYTPYRTAYAGVLEGLEPPPPSLNLQLSPYVLGALGSERGLFDELTAGGELKWSPTSSVVVDATINSDFSQSDVDRAFINLRRFSVLLPERRRFFLEGAGLLTLGNTEVLTPFTTRRIGLDASGKPVPIDLGVRALARTQSQDLAAMVVTTRTVDQQPRSSFLVGRWSRSVSPALRLGAFFAGRRDEDSAEASSRTELVPAVDFQLRDGSFYAEGMASAALASRATGGTALHFYTYYNSNSLYAGYFVDWISAAYAPSTGFVATRDLVVNSPALSLDWRPTWKPSWVRKLAPAITTYFYHRASDLAFSEGYVTLTPLAVTTRSGHTLSLDLGPEWQRVTAPLELAPGATIPVGWYQSVRAKLSLDSDSSQRWGGSLSVDTGPWYDGARTTLRLSARLAPIPHLGVLASLEHNRLTELGEAEEDSRSHLWSVELRAAASPTLQLIGLLERNSASGLFAANIRLLWEFLPLSSLALVYSDASSDSGDSARRSWQIAAKLTVLRQL